MTTIRFGAFGGDQAVSGAAARGAQGGVRAGTGLRALPGAGRDAQERGVRRGQRRRRPDVRRGGPRCQRGRAGRCRSSVAPASCWRRCWARSACSEDVFIANVLKCRPPGNRDPLPVEIENCRDYLYSQVELIRPRVICSLGNFSTKLLQGAIRPASPACTANPRSSRSARRTVRLYPIFHPAAALYTPRMLETLREDFSRLPELLAQPEPQNNIWTRRAAPRAGGGEQDAGGATQQGGTRGHPVDQLDLF